ncbi:hypothetical protein [uncultured Tenacibaculum sp.]|uniref:hypothetical protein n=1 Tax=uncultured Tenacibaculum sp. TaxID=174713 RepID=UPI002609481A|nr:hypothetical protein [uncultured Tenacibaculum sp.]
MEISNENKINSSKYGVQDYMSIGYVFLLILGVINQTIFYGFLNINIFEYTSVLDVLLSPVAILTDRWIIFVTAVILLIVMVGYFELMKKFYARLAKKEKYQQGKKKEQIDKILSNLNRKYSIIPFLLFALACMYLGLGFGTGQKTKDRINNFDYTYSNEIVFDDGEKKKVKIIGKNSLYIFYVTKEDTHVNIAPIDGNIKLIKEIKE